MVAMHTMELNLFCYQDTSSSLCIYTGVHHHQCNLLYISLMCSCCGAGTAADTENVTEMISANLELHRLSTGRKVRTTNEATIDTLYICVVYL